MREQTLTADIQDETNAELRSRNQMLMNILIELLMMVYKKLSKIIKMQSQIFIMID